MSITPIEGDESHASAEATTETRRSGVRARLGGVLTSLGRFVRSLAGAGSSDSTPQSGGDTDETDGAPALRVGGQRRLESGRESDGAPAARGHLPGSAELVAERDGESLRVYNPEHTDAYLASDTWEEIER